MSLVLNIIGETSARFIRTQTGTAWARIHAPKAGGVIDADDEHLPAGILADSQQQHSDRGREGHVGATADGGAAAAGLGWSNAFPCDDEVRSDEEGKAAAAERSFHSDPTADKIAGEEIEDEKKAAASRRTKDHFDPTEQATFYQTFDEVLRGYGMQFSSQAVVGGDVQCRDPAIIRSLCSKNTHVLLLECSYY